MATTAVETLAAPPSTGGPAFRPDIQALRAIAVGLVVVYHLWPASLPGGYVGVDIFFVISGFLITSHMWREAAESGRIRLGRFWARRARRLLPSALLVLLSTAVASIVLAPPHLIERFLHETLAAAFYVENWFLAAASVDYLGSTAEQSPVVHYWSLSVEEQFYVLLPLLLVAALAVAARLRGDRRRAVVVMLALVGAGSLAYSIWFTAASSAAYFSTLTRLWEFVAGAVLAMLVRDAARRPMLVIAGLALIGVAAVTFTGETAFPGHLAALPVVGTMLALAGGARSFLAAVGRWAPVGHLGRTSYAIYLWHWPLLVLAPFALGRDLTDLDRGVILALTLALATASTLLVEDPVRFSPRLLGGRSPRVVGAWALAGMAVIVLVVGAWTVADRNRAAADAALVDAAEAQMETSEECAGAEPAAAGAVCDTILQPASFVPPLADLESDDANRGECWSGLTDPEYRECTIGPRTGFDTRLLVLGDSHSNQLIPAYERIAEERGWRIDLAGHAGCYFTTRALMREGSDERAACDAWREAALARAAAAEGYDAVVVTRKMSGDRAEVAGAEVAGLVEAWSAVAPGTPVVVVLDNPRLGDDFVTCLDRAGIGRAAACAMPRQQALLPDLLAEAARDVARAQVVDLSDAHCTAGACPPVIGGLVAYRPDGHHLTATYARTLAPLLADRIEDAVAAAGRPSPFEAAGEPREGSGGE